MADRTETRLFISKIDPRVQSLIASPYVQQHLHLTGLINHRGQMPSYNHSLRGVSYGKRQRRERDAITQEIVARAVKIDQNHRLSRRHQFEVAARRVVNNNFDILSRQYRKQTDIRRKSREKSAPGCLTKGDSDGERQPRVTSAGNRQPKSNNDSNEFDHERNRLVQRSKSGVVHVERHACEVTMSYKSKTISQNANPTADEIVVMQQHSTGENLIVYRGFLTQGELFSFKSQRRPTSALSLAFYAKGFIDSIVNDCCEFRYGRRSRQTNEHDQFVVERVRRASPCDKCRRKYWKEISSSKMTQNETIPQISLAPVANISMSNEESFMSGNLSPTSSKHHETKNISRKSSFTDNENKDKQVTNKYRSKRVSSSKKQLATERAAMVGFNLLESALVQHDQSSNNTSIANESSIKRSNAMNEKTSSMPSERAPPSLDRTDTAPWENSSANTTINDHRNSFQLFVDQLQQQLHEQQAQSSISARPEKSIENYIYIMDGTLTVSDKEKRKLRGLINFGLTFNDMNNEECLKFINHIVHEQIILILSKKTMRKLHVNIQNARQVRLIYIIHYRDVQFAEWEKIRGIHANLSSVCHQLKTDLKFLTHNLTTILSVPANDTNDSPFAYIQVLKDILLEVDETTDLKKEMLDYCRETYADNENQMKLINEFEQRFQSDQSIRWYSRQETFLFKMLTRALRVPDPDILFKLRFFIQHLHRQLKSNIPSNSMTVYRTQYISNDDFARIVDNRDGFLAFNQFLFTNKTKIIPTPQATDLPIDKSHLKLVVFQMELGSTTPRATIDTNSDEVLLTTAVVFRISHIEQIDTETTLIKLTSNDEVLKPAQEVTKNVREAARAPFPLLRMAKLMKYMEYTYYTEYFCLILIDNPTTVNNENANLTVGGLFHALCSFYYEQEQYDRALEQLEKSLKVYLRVLPPDDIKLTPTYNNMGSIYHKQGLDDYALQLHRKAYDIQVKSSNPDPDSVAAYAGNIASVLIKQNKYEEAIPYLQRDLQIRQRLHSEGDDVNLAVKYHNLAGAQFRIHKFAEALDNYQKCLDIELRVHPITHPTVAVTYYNMATALEGLGQLKEAIEMIHKARKRLLLTRDENDEEVKMHQEYEQRLQQKLWVKSLFGTN